MRDLIRHAKESNTSEGRLVAEFVEEMLNEGVDEEVMEASIMAVSEWAHLFRRRVLDKQKTRRGY